MKHKSSFRAIGSAALLAASFALPAAAVEVAPRITDREIIESLGELKAGQKALEAGQKVLEEKMDQRFEAVDQRFEAVNQRIDDLHGTMLALFSALIVLFVAQLGYIVWDRRTALRPVQEKIDRLDRDLQRDIELKSVQGSQLARVVEALQRLGRDDERIASVLRSVSLM